MTEQERDDEPETEPEQPTVESLKLYVNKTNTSKGFTKDQTFYIFI